MDALTEICITGELKWDESTPRTIPAASSSQNTAFGSLTDGDSPHYDYAAPYPAEQSVEALSNNLASTTLSGQASTLSQGTSPISSYTSSSSTSGD